MFSFQVSSQTIEKGYYMFPVRPGEANYLAGTMGELRATHFHTGLDIKTSGITGLPIFAAADGYIQRVRVSLSGYGNALYMVHPNGTITVYAHLKEFQEDIANFVRSEQYKQESFPVDINIKKGRFSFKKGEVIALSGNSGSSSGPHLHFEIRDLNHKVLDPLLYGFKEIKDAIPPTLAKIAFVTMDKDSRVNGMFGRFEFDIIKRDKNYTLEVPVTLFGNIGVEVYVYDKFDGARNKNGVLSQTLMFDYEPIFSQDIDRIEFNKQRNILSHTNYKRSKEGGRRFNKYYVDDGNLLDYYDTNGQGGIISIFDPLEHSIDIQLEDSYQNVVQYHLPLNDAGYSKNLARKDMYFLNKRRFDVRGNTLEIIGSASEEDCFARIFIEGEEYLYAHAYRAEGKYFYLWDLTTGLPDSANVCGENITFDFKKMVPAGQKSIFTDQSVDINFPKYALFDTLFLQYEKTEDSLNKKEFFHFKHVDIPLRQSANVLFKPKWSIDTGKSAIYAVDGKGRMAFVGGEWEGGNIKLKTKDLLNYTIATDTVPPKIRRLKSSKAKIKLKIEDEMSGIHSYRAELDGKWLLMSFDAKSGILLPDPKVKLQGKFTFVMKDNANNFTKYETVFE